MGWRRKRGLKDTTFDSKVEKIYWRVRLNKRRLKDFINCVKVNLDLSNIKYKHRYIYNQCCLGLSSDIRVKNMARE